MPILDLVSPNGDLARDAIFRILAVMCHPCDVKARKEILRSVGAELRAHTRGRPPKPAESIFRRTCDAFRGGSVAGSILRRLIQIQDDGGSPNLTEAYQRMSEHIASELRNDPELKNQPENFRLRGLMNKKAALDAWRDYRSVAHLWAAYIGSQEEDGSEFDIADFRNLRNFVAASQYYAFRGFKIRLKTRRPQRALDIRTGWRFHLPHSWKPISFDASSVRGCN